MEKNYDEVIAEMLIELDQLHRKGMAQDQRNAKFDKRMDLTIKRMVMAEKRLEKIDQRLDATDKRMEAFDRRMDAHEKRMEAFDKKLEQSIKDQLEFSRMQSKMNQYFLSVIHKRSNGKG
ncbi:MAG: hypothetical protein K2U26_19370 [Cyclobacteriaceae bacterium]|nr:hypothetical protein [Cyclobacteriaceae bacterium]